MIRGILASFGFAFQGIISTVRNERNFRIDLVAVFYVTVFAFLYGLDRHDSAVLALTLLIVPVCELVNTAVENMVNLQTTEKNAFAKIAKDTAAAAVLLSSIGAVIVAVCLFSDPEKLRRVFSLVFTVPGILILLVTAVLSALFVRFKTR